jgi:hypothetical protein
VQQLPLLDIVLMKPKSKVSTTVVNSAFGYNRREQAQEDMSVIFDAAHHSLLIVLLRATSEIQNCSLLIPQLS